MANVLRIGLGLGSPPASLCRLLRRSPQAAGHGNSGTLGAIELNEYSSLQVLRCLIVLPTRITFENTVNVVRLYRIPTSPTRLALFGTWRSLYCIQHKQSRPRSLSNISRDLNMTSHSQNTNMQTQPPRDRTLVHPCKGFLCALAISWEVLGARKTKTNTCRLIIKVLQQRELANKGPQRPLYFSSFSQSSSH